MNAEEKRIAQLLAYRPVLRRWCHALLHNETEADDAAQQVLLLAYEQRQTFRSEAALATWLYRIARNHCLNRLRDPFLRVVSLDSPHKAEDMARLANRACVESVEDGVLCEQALAAILLQAQNGKPLWDELDYRIFQAYYAPTLTAAAPRHFTEIACLVHRPVDTVKDRFYRHIRPALRRVGEQFELRPKR